MISLPKSFLQVCSFLIADYVASGVAAFYFGSMLGEFLLVGLRPVLGAL
jgi:hypothetical protein